MESYATKRCADPGAFYSSPEEVLDDPRLTTGEKEYILKSMAVDAELLNTDELADTATGEHPADLTAIHKALNQLGQAHSFDPQSVGLKDEAGTERKAFTRIVAAVAGNDDLDREVLKVTESVIQLSGGEVTYVSVVPPFPNTALYGAASPMGGIAVAPPEMQDDLKARMEERKAILRDFLASRTSTSSPYYLEVCHGQVDDEVLRIAEEHSANLIIIGSHDRSWIEGLFSSETSRHVAKSAMCPVLIVPESGNH